MDDQNINGNGHSSIPAYQVLDSLEAANALDGSKTMEPFGSGPAMPQMPQMPHSTEFSEEPQMGYLGGKKGDPKTEIPNGAQNYQQPQPEYPNGPQYYQQPQPGYPNGAQNYQQPQPGYPNGQPSYQMPQNEYTQPYGYGDQQMYGYSAPQMQYMPNYATKFCKYCAAKIPQDAVICTACGRQVESLVQGQYIFNNTEYNAPINYANMNAMMAGAKPKDKWISFILCVVLGFFGAHKFYEGKVGWGLLYLCTVGLCGIGWLVDIILILLKPDPYYV